MKLTVSTEMVNAAWNEAKTRRMTGLPTDFRAVLEAAFAVRHYDPVADERENCLKIVEGQAEAWVKEKTGDYWSGYRDAIDDAAEDIRKGLPAAGRLALKEKT